MNRLAEEMVFSGLSTAWRLASWPTRRSPVLVNATTEGVKRLPSLLMITVGFPPSITATTEFVVPRSMPTVFAIPSPHCVHNTLCSFRDLASFQIAAYLAAMDLSAAPSEGQCHAQHAEEDGVRSNQRLSAHAIGHALQGMYHAVCR